MLHRSTSLQTLSLILLALTLPAAAFAQQDTTYIEREVETSFTVYPSPIWSRTAGFAAGVGYEIEHLLFPKTRILVTARPGQHLGRYTASYFVQDAYEDALYALANVYYETTGRQWYYGLGPTSSIDDEIAVEKDMLEAEARFGLRPVGGAFLLQPSVKYIRHEVHDFRSTEDAALVRLDARSQQNLFYAAGGLPGAPEVQEGFAVGLSGGFDFRDRPVRPESGLLLQGSAHRYRFSASPDIEYDRYAIYAYGYVPVGFNRLALRAVTQLTEPRSNATIPFYLLPSLNGDLLPGYAWNRFYGNDLLVMSMEYAVSLFNLLDFAALDGLVSVGAGNIYNDLFDEFEAAVSFESDIEEGSRYPLRPSAAIGFNVQSYDPGGWNMRVLLGWGTEGVRLVRFGFVHDVRDLQLEKR